MKFLTPEQFTEMCQLQDSLNTATSGPNWKQLGQDWELAIKDEVMEFFNYVGWKWWKKKDPKKNATDLQARLELVDIWHFVLSQLLEVEEEKKENAKKAGRRYSPPYPRIKEDTEAFDPENIPLLKRFSQVDSPVPPALKIFHLNCGIEATRWSWEGLYKAYIGKVALNNFRQANGYKEGSYVKIWETIQSPGPCGDVYDYLEDNYFLEQIMNLLSASGELTYQNVYDRLNLQYKTVLTSQ